MENVNEEARRTQNIEIVLSIAFVLFTAIIAMLIV